MVDARGIASKAGDSQAECVSLTQALDSTLRISHHGVMNG